MLNCIQSLVLRHIKRSVLIQWQILELQGLAIVFLFFQKKFYEVNLDIFNGFIVIFTPPGDFKLGGVKFRFIGEISE